MKTRSVQDVFRAVVAAGWYASHVYASEFMCRALRQAVLDDVITESEQIDATAAIEHYMEVLGGNYCGRKSTIMYWALSNAGLIPGKSNIGAGVWATILGRSFYYNWDKRPW
jgi:hypothetical protein